MRSIWIAVTFFFSIQIFAGGEGSGGGGVIKHQLALLKQTGLLQVQFISHEYAHGDSVLKFSITTADGNQLTLTSSEESLSEFAPNILEALEISFEHESAIEITEI